MDMALSDPDKPCQNGADESFNDKFRDECLKEHWLTALAHARAVIAASTWRLASLTSLVRTAQTKASPASFEMNALRSTGSRRLLTLRLSWRQGDNEQSPHSALNYLALSEFAAKHRANAEAPAAFQELV